MQDPMFDVDDALHQLIQAEGSDLHLKVPAPPIMRVHGELRPIEDAASDGRGPSQATSRSFWASASDWSFLSDWFSIWRMRSRVTLNVRPTSSSVRGCSPPRP